MINPATVTNYNRTHVQLEEFILFAINVAGKKSAVEAPKLDKFLTSLKNLYGNLCEHADSPFSLIRYAWAEGKLMELMKEHAISPYKQRYNSYVDVMWISDLYLVYNDNYYTQEFGPVFRSINLKLTYWLNI